MDSFAYASSVKISRMRRMNISSNNKEDGSVTRHIIRTIRMNKRAKLTPTSNNISITRWRMRGNSTRLCNFNLSILIMSYLICICENRSKIH